MPNETAARKDVVGFGSLNVDYIYETEDLSFLDPFYPQGGKRREWVLTDEREILALKAALDQKACLVSRSGGGSAANTIYSLTRLGFQTGFLGKIGHDDDGDFILREMDPVPDKQIRRDHWTGNALIVLGPNRDRIILLIPNANKSLTWSDVDPEFVRSFSVLHLTSLLGRGFGLQVQLVEEVAGQVRISCDPGEVYAQRGLEDLKPLIARCDFLFLTERELSLMTGLGSAEAVKALQALGTGMIIMKKKGSGAIVCRGRDRWELPAEIIRAQDTTGAGDVFAAGFLAGWLKGCPPPDCGRLGLAMAHKSMTGLGRAAYPDQGDFEQVLNRLKHSS